MTTNLEFIHNKIADTGISLTSLGFGTAAIGGLFEPVVTKDGEKVLKSAFDHGLHYVDTAPYYGLGRSEHMVGNILRGEDCIVSTKVGRILKPGAMSNPAQIGWPDALPFNPVFDYSYDGIMRSFEDSQQRLGMDHIDILYVHDIGEMTHGGDNEEYFKILADDGYRALSDLRKSGLVKAIGIGVNEIDICHDILKIGDWDVFLLAGRYSLLEQMSLDYLLPQCQKNDVSIVIGGPYNSGILVGGYTWNYGKAPDYIITKVKSLNVVANEFNIPLAAAALQFPLAHPVIASVIPGIRNMAQLETTLEWANISIPTEFWTELKNRNLLHPAAPTPIENPYHGK